MVKVINGLIFENDKVLVVKKKKVYILPGGKLEGGESHYTCLRREFDEELSGTKINVGIKYDSFEGITPHSKKPVIADVYFCDLIGKIGNPSQEILDRKYVGKKDLGDCVFSDVTKDILNKLAEDNLIF